MLLGKKNIHGQNFLYSIIGISMFLTALLTAIMLGSLLIFGSMGYWGLAVLPFTFVVWEMMWAEIGYRRVGITLCLIQASVAFLAHYPVIKSGGLVGVGIGLWLTFAAAVAIFWKSTPDAGLSGKHKNRSEEGGLGA